jgi:hypothetical protein
LLFRDDREDLDRGFRDVIINSYLPDPESILRIPQSSKALDPVSARPSRLAPEMPLECVLNLGSDVRREVSEIANRAGSQDDLVSHAGQRIARSSVRFKPG